MTLTYPIERGYEGRIYYGVAGAEATTLIPNTTDHDESWDPETAETTDRGDGTDVPIVTEDVVAMKVQITFKMRKKRGDATQLALRAAAKSGTPVAIRTKDIPGGVGFNGDCLITCRKLKPMKGVSELEFTARPSAQGGRTPVLEA